MYFENEALNAGQPFNYTSTGQKYNPRERQLILALYRWAGGDSSPLQRHNRPSSSRLRGVLQRADAQPRNYTVPTLAYRNGDLSSLLLGPIKDSNGNPVLDCLGRQMINGAVYNPATTRTATCTNGSTATVRDPFPNNFIGAPTHGTRWRRRFLLTFLPHRGHCQRVSKQLPKFAAEQQIPVT